MTGASRFPKLGQMQIVLPAEIRVWLKFAIGESVREFAAQVEMSPQYIYAVLRGEKEPSPLLLEKIGLEVVYRVRIVSRDRAKSKSGVRRAGPAEETQAPAAGKKLATTKRTASAGPKRNGGPGKSA